MTSREPFFFLQKQSQKPMRRLWSKQGSQRVTKRPEVALTAGVKSQGGEGRNRKSRETELAWTGATCVSVCGSAGQAV